MTEAQKVLEQIARLARDYPFPDARETGVPWTKEEQALNQIGNEAAGALGRR